LNNLCQLLTSVNFHFYKHTAQDRYATFFFGHYSDARRTLLYVNCGHNAPILLRRGGAVERLDATATVIGMFPDWKCSTAEVALETGDVLGIYTDGITETVGRDGEQFGEARLLETLQNYRHLEAADMVRNVENAVQQFKCGEPRDDLTLVIARAR
jgi:sigma-B regulation protein RsbU (phosphoserine phosphatase)